MSLHSPSLGRSAAVMGHRGHIPDAEDLEAGPLKGTNGRLPPGPGPLDQDLYLPHPVLYRFLGGLVCRHLRGVRGALAGPLEAGTASGARGDDIAARVGESDYSVIEGSLDISPAPRYRLPLSPFGSGPSFCLCHSFLPKIPVKALTCRCALWPSVQEQTRSLRLCGGLHEPHRPARPVHFLARARRLPAPVRRGPLRVRAFVRVRWPPTGSPRRWRRPL